MDDLKLAKAFSEIAKGFNRASKILQGKEKVKIVDSPMSLKEFVAHCDKSKLRSHKLVGDWAGLVNATCISKDQWTIFFKRHIKDATDLAKFDDTQIYDAFKKVTKADLPKSTMRTLIKYIV